MTDRRSSTSKTKSVPHPLQSSEWADFRKNWGNEVVKTKFGYLTLHKIPLTNYKIGMFIKGPVPSQKMFDGLKKICEKHNLVFIKLEPNVAFGDDEMKHVASKKESESLVKLMKKNGCVSGKTLFTPTTFWIDLTKSEEELLKGISEMCR